MPRLKLLMPALGSPLPGLADVEGGAGRCTGNGLSVEGRRALKRRRHGDAAVQIDAELLDGVPAGISATVTLRIDLILAPGSERD